MPKFLIKVLYIGLYLGAKIFDKGFVHWALSQGTAIEILEPENLRQKIKDEIRKMNEIYIANI